MYQGKYIKSRKRNVRKRISVLLASLMLVLLSSIPGTIAWISTDEGPVDNTFTLAQVPISVQEDFENGVKNNVAIQNDGDTDAYIRAQVIVTWQDSNGYIYGEKPVEDQDYHIDWSMTDWKLHSDGYYYCTRSVAPKASTGELFTNCSQVEGKAPKGYSLCVEIVAQSIQARGKNSAGVKPVELAWGLDPETLD